MFNNMVTYLSKFTDVLGEEIENSQPFSLPSSNVSEAENEFHRNNSSHPLTIPRPAKGTGQNGDFRSVEEIDSKYKHIFTYPYFNLVQSRVIDDALYSDKSIVVCAPTGSGKTVIFEMAIVQLLMEIDDNQWEGDFKIIYMAPVKSLCTERLTEWYPKFTKLGHLCIEVTGDTDVDFQRLEPYKIIITTPEKWDMLTRRWRDHRGLVELIKLFLIDEVHILNDATRGPVLEAVVSRMKTIQESAQSAYRIEQLTKQYQANSSHSSSNTDQLALVTRDRKDIGPKIRFVAVSATVSNPEDVAEWLGNTEKNAVYYKFGDESRPVKLRRIVEGYPCAEGTSIFKFDIILNYKLWPIIQKYNDGKPTLIFCNTRKSVTMTAETLSKELTVTFSPEQKAKLVTLASTIKTKKLQSLILSGVGCHHAGLLYEERVNIENSFRNRELPILITTTTLAMGVNLPAHLVIIKNTQQYVNGAYQEYSISTVLQMVGRAGRPQYDTEATAVIMTTLKDKPRYQSLVGGSEPLQSYLHKRIAENLNSEAALGTITDVAQCVQWLRSTFLYVRAGKDPRRYLGLPQNAPAHQITKKIEELCVKAMNGLATSGLITMDDASCIESTEAGRLMSVYYLDVETMKQIMKINGSETLDQLLWLVCESHELSDNHLRMDERRILNSLNRNTKAATIRFPMKGKITTRQMKLSCIIQAILGCLQIPEPSLHQEGMKIMRIAERVCKCLLAYVTRPDLISSRPIYFSAILNAILLNKCICSHLWENSPYVSKQLRGIGPAFSTLLATAGKTSFMLLEESHPRDLERIMNKGPPAGNIIRKQIALLPKYQLTATPIDSNTVCFKLQLLNQAYMSENIDSVTAGVNHKSYIIIGDSDNHLLLLTSFKDKDLLGMYDGSMSHEIARQSGNEHKIKCHCISTLFVGIDVQCEYVFKEVGPLFTKEDFVSYPSFEGELPETPKFIQPSIADIFKERKRKNNVNITQSKEKKKRDCALIEKFKQLKDNFGVASKELREDLNQTTELSTSLVHEFNNNSSSLPITTHLNNTIISNDQIISNVQINNKELEDFTDLTLTYPNFENVDDVDFDVDDTICDDEINNILNDIEKEIHRKSNTFNPKKVENKNYFAEEKHNKEQSYNTNRLQPRLHQGIEKKRFQTPSKNRKLLTTKSNYNFIDKIDLKNSNPEIDEDKSKSGMGLPDSIKTYITKYLQNQRLNEKHVDDPLIEIIDTNNQEIDKDKCVYNLKKTTDLNTVATPLLKVQDDEIHNTFATSTSSAPQHQVYEIDDNLANNSSARQIEILENEIHDNFVPNTSNAQQLKVENIEMSCQNMKFTSKTPPYKPRFAYLSDTLIELDITPSVYIANNKCQKKDILREDLNTCTSEKQDVDIKEPTNDINIIEINDDSDDITQLVTQKVISLPASPEKNSVVYNNNELEKNIVLPSNSDEKCTEINDFAINFLEETKPVKNKSLALLDQKNADHENAEIPVHITKSANCNLQILSQQKLKQNNKFFNESQELLQENPHVQECTKTSSGVRSNNEMMNLENKIIHKYSFTRTGINVSSKNLPDRKIHVVRKICIDLDVTEVITNPVSYCNKSNEETTNIATAGSDFGNYQSPSTPINNLECTNDMTRNILAIEKTTKPLSNKISTLESSLRTFEYGYLGENSKNTKESDNTNRTNTAQSLVDNVINEIVEDKNDEVCIKNLKSEKTEQRENCVKKQYNDDDKVQQTVSQMNKKHEEGSSIANILQKYTKLLHSKSVNDTTVPSQETCKDNIPEKDIQQTIGKNNHNKKPKRCYKISDIQNDRVPLPEGINKIISPYSKTFENPVVNDTAQDNFVYVNNQINNPTIFNNFIEAKSLNTNQNQLLELPYVAEDSENNDNDIIDLKSLSYTNSQLSNVFDDFKIEPTILDPKTLLQSFNKHSIADLIIPPPPDFSEDVNQLTDNLDFKHSTMNNESSFPILKYDIQENEDKPFNGLDIDKTHYPENTNTVHCSLNTYFDSKSFGKEKQSPNNSNVHSQYIDVEDDTNKTLHEVDSTLTKEVETWTFSREDSLQEPRQSIVPTFTMSQNVSRSQPEVNFHILQSFKFRPKSKLRGSNLHQSQRNSFKRKWPSVKRNNFR